MRGFRRRAAKVDKNQPSIVSDLRCFPGVAVEVGHDDILVGFRGKTYWFEIKSESALSKRTGEVLESNKKGSQIELEANWKGHYAIVSTLEEILTEIGIITEGE